MGGADFGIIPGVGYSIAELSDLLKAKDEDMRRMVAAHASMPPAPFDTGTWDNEWATLQANYKTARDIAQGALDAAKWNPLPASLISADSSYKGLLTALNPTWQSNTPAPGSYGDLSAQLAAMGASFDTSPLPQPQQGSDAELTAYKGAKQTTTAIEEAEKAAAGGAAAAAKALLPQWLIPVAIVAVLAVLVVPQLTTAGAVRGLLR